MRTCASSSCEWSTFAKHVAGDWVGTLREFRGQDGEPIALAPMYVPEAYREWGSNLYSWQIHTITATDIPTEGKLKGGVDHMLRKLIPADTCECFDLEVLSSSTRMLKTDPENEGESKTILRDGSYSAGTRRLSKSAGDFVLETCLVCDTTTSCDKRVRIRQHISYSSLKKKFDLIKVELFEEVRHRRDPNKRSEDPLENVVLESESVSIQQKAEREAALEHDDEDEDEDEVFRKLMREGKWGPFVGKEYYLEMDDSPQGGSFREFPTRSDPITPFDPVAGKGTLHLPFGCFVSERYDMNSVVFEAGCLVYHSDDQTWVRKLLQRQYDHETGFLKKLIIGEQKGKVGF